MRIWSWREVDRKERNGVTRSRTKAVPAMIATVYPYLPPETLDYIVDFLHDKRETLEQCCLVSKSWVPRTRKHLFADIRFYCAADLESWKKAFPDHSSSPAYHTRALLVGCPEVVTNADAGGGGWVRTFSRVIRLGVHGNPATVSGREVSLTPFHRFSLSLKDLHIVSKTLPDSQIFDLISTLPLLEDLTLGINGVDVDGLNSDAPLITVQPSTSPAFTGTLDLALFKGMGPTTRWLLSSPNNLHFRKLMLSWAHEQDHQWINALVVGCSDTLENLTITSYLRRDPNPASINLSEATKLERAVFRPTSLRVKWITLALQTITPKHRDLRHILIYSPHDLAQVRVSANVRQTVGEFFCGQWSELDHVLVQFWESHSVRPMISYYIPLEGEKKETSECLECLLPKITKRGVVDLVQWHGHQ
ncbi:hypothetical protein BDM02DRAFT_2890061 [Thelephora ganbajun]|uniref:Uncharacterized protein n=1 Tax=Thelephora ganbajun TaxID=370292 RepID=A0ACB6ZBR4_THEGA|nr:hypothetical protein BDM02DRAFT_2890061 [Thelephora ganbajun]